MSIAKPTLSDCADLPVSFGSESDASELQQTVVRDMPKAREQCAPSPVDREPRFVDEQTTLKSILNDKSSLYQPLLGAPNYEGGD